MKKKRKIVLIVSVAAALVLFGIFAVCSAYSTWIAPIEGETETVSSPEYADEEEPSEESSSLADDPSEEGSLDVGGDEESEAPTETTEDEEETEEKVEELPTLEFTSLGNGTCCVTGIGTVTSSYIVIPQKSPEGDVVTEIAEKAFFACEFIRAVDIPSTVSVIGDMAFADCPELVYISVDKSNKMYVDVGGILYSSDMSRIVACPAANGASSITLPTSVKIIAPMAFYGCGGLKTIYYDGSFEDWSKIAVGDMNYSLYTASIVCKETE